MSNRIPNTIVTLRYLLNVCRTPMRSALAALRSRATGVQ
jgi:hypothetical protein